MNRGKSLPDVTDVMLDIWKEIGNESHLQVSGFSMHPLIEPGERVIVKHSDNNITCGSVVAFKRGMRIVVHRVVRVSEVCGEMIFLCRGDNNLFLDARVKRSTILGKVVVVEKSSGKSVYLESTVWRAIGWMTVLCFDHSRGLPRILAQRRVAKMFDRIGLRVASIFISGKENQP